MSGTHTQAMSWNDAFFYYWAGALTRSGTGAFSNVGLVL
jgi:hypothetical protein